MTTRVAVLMACRNRSAMTKRCLTDVIAAGSASETLVHGFVVNDGSTDDTADILAEFPEVTVIDGPGDWYWARSMAEAERAASAWDPDWIVWLNDDVLLDAAGLANVFRGLSSELRPTILVGAIADRTGDVIYGLRKLSGRPGAYPLTLDPSVAVTFNGNLVLVNESARRLVGPIDGRFSHAYADLDYGLRARKRDVPIDYLGILGVGEANPATGRMFDPSLNLRLRWSAAMSRKGIPPRDHMRFLVRHGGRLWWWWFIRSYFSVIRRRKR